MIGEYFININNKKVGLLFTAHFHVIAAEKKLNDKIIGMIADKLDIIKRKKDNKEDYGNDERTLKGLISASHANNIYIAALTYVECERMTEGNIELEAVTYKDVQSWCLNRENYKTFNDLMEVYNLCNAGKIVEEAKTIVKKKATKRKSWIIGKLKSFL